MSCGEDFLLFAVGLLSIATIVATSLFLKHKVVTPLTAAVIPSDPVQDKMDRFTDWLALHSNTGELTVPPLSRVRVMRESTGERHVIAKQSLLARQLVMELPLKVAMTASQGRSLLRDVFGPHAVHDLREDYVLTLYLLRERQLGARSFYAPWLDVLPTTIYNGITMTEDDTSCLVPPARKQPEVMRSEVHTLYDLARNIITEKPNAFFNDGETNDTESFLTLGKVAWAYANVVTRALQINTDVMLVPLLDMMNHKPEGAIFGKTKKAIQVETLTPITSNKEVFLNYHNDEPEGLMAVLVNYGFVDEKAPLVESYYVMEAQSIDEARLRPIGCYESHKLVFRYSGEASEVLWKCVMSDTILLLPDSSPSEKDSLLTAYLANRLVKENDSMYQKVMRKASQRLANHSRVMKKLVPASHNPGCANANQHIIRANVILRNVWNEVIERYSKMSIDF